MLALIMAGGSGSRLNMGEKPLVRILDRPMIDYVIQAFDRSGCTALVVVSPHTPVTRNWCRAHGIDVCTSAGAGYIPDLIEAVNELGEKYPLFTSVSDIPCITVPIIHKIRETYQASGRDACSTWVTARLCERSGCRTSIHETIDGEPASPAGINILRGDLIREEQDELKLLMHEKQLAFNINTREDLRIVDRYFRNLMNSGSIG
jgi:adenosylcobinamide-phosphate guanylyltransferase